MVLKHGAIKTAWILHHPTFNKICVDDSIIMIFIPYSVYSHRIRKVDRWAAWKGECKIRSIYSISRSDIVYMENCCVVIDQMSFLWGEGQYIRKWAIESSFSWHNWYIVFIYSFYGFQSPLFFDTYGLFTGNISSTMFPFKVKLLYQKSTHKSPIFGTSIHSFSICSLSICLQAYVSLFLFSILF